MGCNSVGEREDGRREGRAGHARLCRPLDLGWLLEGSYRKIVKDIKQEDNRSGLIYGSKRLL